MLNNYIQEEHTSKEKQVAYDPPSVPLKPEESEYMASKPRDEEQGNPASSNNAMVAQSGGEIDDALPLAPSGARLLRLQDSSFSEQLRGLRAEAGLTIADVASRVRSSQAFIVNLESGELHKIDQHEHYCKSFIERICMLYQVAPEELLEKFDKERAQQLAHVKKQGNESFGQGSASYIFAEKDLEPDAEQSSVMNLPAVAIAILVACLFIVLLGARIAQKNRDRKSAEAIQQIQQGLNRPLRIEKIPLRSLPVPGN
ncbi:MAG: helix-turn-helix domain-containing protein [Oligosphaeraceae bacterium]|nr:helix-turn-helix domain-containing protein [Oligosphaeraceae bacterium]